MHHSGSLLVTLSVILLACTKPAKETPPPDAAIEMNGVDMSLLPDLRQSGVVLYNANREPEAPLQTLKRAGVNTIRLRLWKNPVVSGSDFATVERLSRECKAMGFKILLTVHFSDTWADPGQQATPQQWQQLSFGQLADSVYAYTKFVMEQIAPEYIQIGNEINDGLLWPQGRRANLAQMKQLLNKAIQAVRTTNRNTKIMLHYAGFEDAVAFYTALTDLDYDLIGLSYYPLWHGKSIEALRQTLTTLYTRFGKKISIVETAYPFTLGWNDWTNNILGLDNQLITGIPASPEGQKIFLNQVASLAKAVPGCIGFCYWGGEWVSFRGSTATDGSPWENQALWDFSNTALPVWEVF